jgi:hypothetical protein
VGVLGSTKKVDNSLAVPACDSVQHPHIHVTYSDTIDARHAASSIRLGLLLVPVDPPRPTTNNCPYSLGAAMPRTTIRLGAEGAQGAPVAHGPG